MVGRGEASTRGMALLLLSLGLSLVSAQELNPRAIVRKNYNMAKVGLGSGVWAFPPSGVSDLGGGHGSWRACFSSPSCDGCGGLCEGREDPGRAGRGGPWLGAIHPGARPQEGGTKRSQGCNPGSPPIGALSTGFRSLVFCVHGLG